MKNLPLPLRLMGKPYSTGLTLLLLAASLTTHLAVAQGPSATATAQGRELEGKRLLDQCGVAFRAARYDDAFALCRQSMALGNIDAREGLGVLYEAGTHDYAQAVHYYSLNADIHPVAAHSTAWLYWTGGNGLAVDYAKARFYFEKAAKGGWTGAIAALGFMDELGQGAPRNRERALEHFREAARRGDSWSGDIAKALSNPNAPQKFDSPQAIGHYVADDRFNRWLSSQPVGSTNGEKRPLTWLQMLLNCHAMGHKPGVC
jgi:TPR repeat protein